MRKQKFRGHEFEQMPTIHNTDTGEESEVVWEPPSFSPNPEEIAIINQERELIQKTVSHLSPKQRQAVINTQYKDMSSEEAAEQAGITVPAHKSRQLNAFKNLKRRFRGKGITKS